MTALGSACMALEQEAMLLHHAVDPLVVRGLTTLGHSTSAQDGVHPAIAVEIAPELTGQGLPLRKCEAYDRPYDQHLGSR